MTHEIQTYSDEQSEPGHNEIDFPSPRAEIEKAAAELHALLDEGNITEFIQRNRQFAEWLSTYWSAQFKQATQLLGMGEVHPFDFAVGATRSTTIGNKTIRIFHPGSPFEVGAGLSVTSFVADGTTGEDHSAAFRIYAPRDGTAYGTIDMSSEFHTGLKPNQKREYYIISATRDLVYGLEKVQEFVDPETGFFFERRHQIVPDHETLSQHTYKKIAGV